MPGIVESLPRLTGDIQKDFVTIVEYIGQVYKAISIDQESTGASIGPLPRGWIDGLTLAITGGLITMRRGVCRAEDDQTDIRVDASIFEKSMAAFEAGDGGGMLDQGVRAVNTWYHVFIISNPTTGASDLLASTSLTSPVIPTGFSTKRRILSLRTLSTGAIKPFYQIGDLVLWQSPALDIANAAIGTGPNFTALDLAAVGGVPKDIETRALFNMQVLGAAADRNIYIAHPSLTSLAGSTTAAPLSSIRRNANYAHGGQIECATDIVGRIGARADVAAVLNISTLGWYDPRGRDAA